MFESVREQQHNTIINPTRQQGRSFVETTRDLYYSAAWQVIDEKEGGDKIVNGSTTLEEYTCLGLGSVVKRAHPESGVDLTYIAVSRHRTTNSSAAASAARSDRQIESKSATFHLFDVP